MIFYRSIFPGKNNTEYQIFNFSLIEHHFLWCSKVNSASLLLLLYLFQQRNALFTSNSIDCLCHLMTCFQKMMFIILGLLMFAIANGQQSTMSPCPNYNNSCETCVANNQVSIYLSNSNGYISVYVVYKWRVMSWLFVDIYWLHIWRCTSSQLLGYVSLNIPSIPI